MTTEQQQDPTQDPTPVPEQEQPAPAPTETPSETPATPDPNDAAPSEPEAAPTLTVSEAIGRDAAATASAIAQQTGIKVLDAKYAPIFEQNGDRMFVADAAFAADDPDTADRIGQKSAKTVGLLGLQYTGEVHVIPPEGLRNVPGAVGGYAVAIFAGPTFDAVRAEEEAERAKAVRLVQ